LFIWLTVGTLKIFSDPLLAGRMISVLAGLIQVWTTALIVKKLGGKRIAITFTALAIIGLPFWFFHHRMALIDGLLVTLLSLSVNSLLTASLIKSKRWKSTIWAGLFFGLALLTKLSALLFVPILLLIPWLIKPKKTTRALALSWSAGALLIGLLVFLSLKIQPAFGQLFNRGNDFLYPLSEVLAAKVWPIAFANGRHVWQVLNAYLTWPILILPILGLWQARWRRKHFILLLATLGFLGPIIILSKVLYPRYLLPAALPLTISAALAFEQFFLTTQKLIKKPLSFFIRVSILVFGVTLISSKALEFALISWQNPDYLPLTALDRSQYLEAWSSGNGIKETTDYLLMTTQEHTVAVATEGFFGTLPDGVLMYLHNQDVTNILVEGIGQPVHEIPDSFAQKAQHFEQVWLVVNSHRQMMHLTTNRSDVTLLNEYCRINEAPCLQVWDITNLVHQPK
ncbi:MAG: glycosyltransferase family 39 protein, partial [Candidatus Paceibacterota bacterium]